MDGPKTRAEAETYRYNVWGGNPKGNAWRSDQCAESVHDGGRAPMWHQCNRRSGYGPDKLYCKMHAMLDAKRAEKVETWQKKRDEQDRLYDVVRRKAKKLKKRFGLKVDVHYARPTRGMGFYDGRVVVDVDELLEALDHESCKMP